MSVVQRGPAGHDRATEVDDRLPTAETDAAQHDPFHDVLLRLRLQGAIFLRAEYRDPWSYESLTGQATAQILRPGTDRVILFHVVASGTCWVSVDAGESTGRRMATSSCCPTGTSTGWAGSRTLRQSR